MKYCFEEILSSMSLALDLAEMSIFDDKSIFDSLTEIHYSRANFVDHSKKTTYIVLEMCKHLKIDNYLLEDIYLASKIHDIGAIEALEKSHLNSEFIIGHCITGAEILDNKLFSNISTIIKCHHENWNGSGPLGLSQGSIPIGSQIIRIADVISIKYANSLNTLFEHSEIYKWVNSKRNILFSDSIVDAFLAISKRDSFWLHLFNLSKSDEHLKRIAPSINRTLSLDELESIAYIFSRIVDKKSPFTAKHSREIADLAYGISKYIGFTQEKCQKMKLAGLFHDIGKLAIPSSILNKEGSLTEPEFNIIKSHAFYTDLILSKISNFNDVRQWASNHHEKLNGTGYPNGLNASHLSLEARILAVCDIYQALSEDRPYRKGLSLDESFSILNDMASKNLICEKCVQLLHDSLIS